MYADKASHETNVLIGGEKDAKAGDVMEDWHELLICGDNIVSGEKNLQR